MLAVIATMIHDETVAKGAMPHIRGMRAVKTEDKGSLAAGTVKG